MGRNCYRDRQAKVLESNPGSGRGGTLLINTSSSWHVPNSPLREQLVLGPFPGQGRRPLAAQNCPKLLLCIVNPPCVLSFRRETTKRRNSTHHGAEEGSSAPQPGQDSWHLESFSFIFARQPSERALQMTFPAWLGAIFNLWQMWLDFSSLRFQWKEWRRPSTRISLCQVPVAGCALLFGPWGEAKGVCLPIYLKHLCSRPSHIELGAAPNQDLEQH